MAKTTSQNNNFLEKSIRNKFAHFTRANIFVEATNSTEQHLINNLILVATIFLGLTSPFISDLSVLSQTSRSLLFVSWMLTILSIIFGLYQVYTNIKFLRDAYRLDNKLESIWSSLPQTQSNYNTAMNVSREIQKDNKNQSSFIGLITQAMCLIIAMLITTIIGVNYLTNSVNSNRHENSVRLYKTEQKVMYNGNCRW